jgi:uncharacterized protein YutD
MMQQKERTYRMIYEYKDAWKPELFRERYSEVLDRYDYIVGDWGYNQLRLKGFYRDDHPKATKETSISYLQDYLQEYCNFGCAYFVIEKVQPSDRDRLNLDVGRSESSITITELPSNDRYAAWQAFLEKLQEEREQQKENGEDNKMRRPSRSQAGLNGQSAGGRKSDGVAQERHEGGNGRQAGYGRQQGESFAPKPQSASGDERQRRGGRAETDVRQEKRQAGDAQHDRHGKRRGNGQMNGREANGRDASVPRESQGDGGQPLRQPDRNRGGHAQSQDRQENGAAADENRNAGKTGHKRPWHRHRKFRHQGKPDRPRQQTADGKTRPDGSAGEPK